ncbi:hypothetical protein E2C01_078482 [Portunus trituberculatus]|uniref:Uncharacterized protein n=1 Tax=Portunus trituberculatus TaxID=210409 RepID=A0A5B7IQA1_PORTR|nr:hypothetical protein [Portunus trituberculatus]
MFVAHAVDSLSILCRPGHHEPIPQSFLFNDHPPPPPPTLPPTTTPSHFQQHPTIPPPPQHSPSCLSSHIQFPPPLPVTITSPRFSPSRPSQFLLSVHSHRGHYHHHDSGPKPALLFPI